MRAREKIWLTKIRKKNTVAKETDFGNKVEPSGCTT
jgi:hypothetical protein